MCQALWSTVFNLIYVIWSLISSDRNDTLIVWIDVKRKVFNNQKHNHVKPFKASKESCVMSNLLKQDISVRGSEASFPAAPKLLRNACLQLEESGFFQRNSYFQRGAQTYLFFVWREMHSSQLRAPGWSANGSGGILSADNWGNLPGVKVLFERQE